MEPVRSHASVKLQYRRRCKMVANVRAPAVRVSPTPLPSICQVLSGLLTNSSCPVHSSDMVMRSMPICKHRDTHRQWSTQR